MSGGWTWPNGQSQAPNSNGMVCTDEYGPRAVNPATGAVGLMHWGIDLVGLGGFNRALADGEVIFAAYYGGAGNYIKVRHPGGTVSGYKHNASFLVSVGQLVKRGQALGVTGTTGDSTGIHCHLETAMFDGASPMNPRVFILQRQIEGGGGADTAGIPGTSIPNETPAPTIGVPMFALVADNDTNTWVAVGTAGQVHVTDTADLDAMMRLQNWMLGRVADPNSTNPPVRFNADYFARCQRILRLISPGASVVPDIDEAAFATELAKHMPAGASKADVDKAVAAGVAAVKAAIPTKLTV